MEKGKKLREWTEPKLEDIDGNIELSSGAIIDGIEAGISSS